MLQQLYPSGSSSEDETSVFDMSSVARVYTSNITAMREIIVDKSLLPTQTPTNRGLLNVFTGLVATPVQTKDLLDARNVGSKQYINYVEYYILQKPSTANAPVRKKKLQTMANPATKSKKRMSVKEREQKRIEKCLRRRLSWCNQKGNSYETGLEQYSIYPRAIADCEGIPQKGCKAKWSSKLFKRYPQLSSFCSPPTYYDAIIIDFIFPLHTTPTKGHTIAKYAEMLMKWHILPHYESGATEVHLVFDRRCVGGFNPKAFEQERRDKNLSQTSNHTHLVDLRPNSLTPHPWQDYINCRVCKHAIIEAVGLSYQQTGRKSLEGPQKLILGGCSGSDGPAPDSAWEISTESLVPQPQPVYSSNADEADSRIWRHVAGTTKSNVHETRMYIT